jgi:hypothetical protein
MGDDTVWAELRALEPLLHGTAWPTDRASLERRLAPEYWEVGASGRVYTREVVINEVAARNVDPMDASWVVSDFACAELSDDTYMVTYLLQQGDRPTQRLTLWKRSAGTWQALYHQGTVIADAN